MAGWLLLGPASARGDDPPVSIADLAGYQAALRPDPGTRPAAPVTFRDLWDHPEAYRGRPVTVTGRVARTFRQPGVGQFPPLVEAWITSPRGEPTCLVFPAGPGERDLPSLGATVRFTGTFLRRIEYAGGDTRRVAPLVVGPPPPVATAGGAPTDGTALGPIFGGDHAADWAIGLAAALGVGLVLLRRHLARPPVLILAPIGPAPTFRDGDDAHDSADERHADPGGTDDDDL